jgi:hypothetical protein
MILKVNSDYFPKQHQPSDLVMDKCCAFFAVGTESLKAISMRFCSKRLNNTADNRLDGAFQHAML